MAKPPRRALVDPLGEALHFLRFTGLSYFRCELSSPWGLALPAQPGRLFLHVVTRGRCLLEVKGADPCWLSAGDIAIVPHAKGHWLSSTSGTPKTSIDGLSCDWVSELYAVLRLGGGGGSPSTLICAQMSFDNPAAARLVTLLPRILLPKNEERRNASWERSTLRLMASEAREVRPGGETVITRLADILVIQSIRAWIERDPAAQTGWLGALRDPQVGQALALLHRDPKRPWTLQSLAGEVAMSRSAFAARFAELVGEPAMRYLARWRMNLAAGILEETDVRLAELAHRLGYRSEAAFHRAFKRFVGAAPGAHRQSARLRRRRS